MIKLITLGLILSLILGEMKALKLKRLGSSDAELADICDVYFNVHFFSLEILIDK